ncbi:hypothetical protein MLD38_008819 [Melastoma candidum]|uniref:Uncharacterized protein n=1 Tax=Melastoma candidum TaxID=119954 RepID=A0ACB9RW45_9MYRT|nr:hypothetical protein MLD38_008819 [Melastoma candidum]
MLHSPWQAHSSFVDKLLLAFNLVEVTVKRGIPQSIYYSRCRNLLQYYPLPSLAPSFSPSIYLHKLLHRPNGNIKNWKEPSKPPNRGAEPGSRSRRSTRHLQTQSPLPPHQHPQKPGAVQGSCREWVQ